MGDVSIRHGHVTGSDWRPRDVGLHAKALFDQPDELGYLLRARVAKVENFKC